MSAQDVVRQDLDYICDRLQGEFTRMGGSRLLITGGAGFLGHYLVQSVTHWNARVVEAERIDVTIFDNFIRGIPTWLETLQAEETVKLVRHDITDPLPADLEEPDYIIHAASIASPTFYRQHPIETMDANVNGLRILLEYARLRQEHGDPLSGFLFFSSSEIYGDPDPEHIPTAEDYRGYVSCTGPRACYDESKRYGETLCVNFAQVYGLPIRSARPFNNYGPGLGIADRRVIPDFARNILQNEDLVLLSDGSPTRTFCYVADAVIGYYKVLVNGRSGEAYNIGTETPEVSIRQLADLMAAAASELLGYEGRVVQRTSSDADYLTDNPVRRCPDITKARAELGYEPGIPLEEGLRRSLLWYAGQVAQDARANA